MDADFDYGAFISYSHAVDGELGRRLQRDLEAFAKPWYRRRNLRVFRDETTLALTPRLWSRLEAALSGARYLILLASPESAASAWVGRELEYWLEHRGTESLLIVLTGGEVQWDSGRRGFNPDTSSAIPACLLNAFEEEPFYADLRWVAKSEDMSARHAKYRDVVATLSATLHGVAKDELVGEDIVQHRRVVRLAWGAAMLLAALAIGAGIASIVAIQQRNVAIERERTARAGELSLMAAMLAADEPAEIERSALLAIESLKLHWSPQGQRTLRAALTRLPEIDRLVGEYAHVYESRFSPDGTLLGTASEQGATLWNLETEALHELAGGAAVKDLDFSPDGHFLLTAGDDGVARIWRTGDGNLVASLPHAAPVVSVAYSPDGRWLATGTAEGDSAARIYDARTLEPVLTWQAGNEEMREVVFSRSGRWFGAVATDGPYGVFDGNDGWRRIEHEHATAGVGVDFAFSDDESRFGVTRGNRAAVLSLPEGAIVRELSNSDFVGETNMEFDAWINRIAFSPDSKYFVTGGRDGTARIWDLESGEEVARMRHTSAIVDVAFTPDGQRLATAAWDSTRLWSLPFGEEITRAAWDTSDVVLDVNADGSTFVSGGPDGNLAIWRPARSDLEWSARMSDDVVAVACSPDGSKVAAADDAHQVRLWNAAGEPLPGSARLFVVRRLGFSNTGQFVIARDLNGLHRLDPNGTGDAVVVARTADSMAFAGDSAVVEPRGLDHVRFLDTVSGETRHDIVEDDVVEPVSIDPTGRYALTSFLEGQDGSGRKAFHVWNVADGTIRWQGTPDTAFFSASISASGDRTLVYGDREAFLMTPSGAPRRIEAAGARGFTYLGFNPGETMIAGIAGQDVYIWPVTLDREPFVLTHNSDLSSIDFSDDARYLVTAAGAIISVWNLADGVLLSQWDAPGHVRQACMLGQDAHVVTGDTRDNLTVWDWKPFDLVDRTCALLTRNFTDEEWQRYFPGEAYRATCPGLDVTER